MFNKQTIKSLQRIIDEQNRELSKLRWAATHVEEYEAKQNKLDELIKEQHELCDEARERLKQYIELNKELSLRITECKKEIEKIKSNT